MILYSILNFKVGGTVMFNPDNHGYHNLKAYEKVKGRTGKIYAVTKVQNSQKLSYVISVIWQRNGGLTKQCNYINLKTL